MRGFPLIPFEFRSHSGTNNAAAFFFQMLSFPAMLYNHARPTASFIEELNRTRLALPVSGCARRDYQAGKI